MAVTIERLSEADALSERDRIIAEMGGDRESFFERGDSFALDARGQALYERLKGLDYLLTS